MAQISRRQALQAGGATLFVGLAGCSNIMGSSPPTVDRLVLRSDTGDKERIHTQKTHAPKDGSPVRSAADYDAPASGQLRFVDLNDGPGFYNIRAWADNHRTTSALAYNSHKEGAPSHDLQFVFVVREDGSLWSNIDETGAEITIPGPDE